MKGYIGAIDQGTTSTRFMVFDKAARVVAVAQKEHEQIFPRPGWVEHDALEILRRTEEVIAEALEQRGLRASDLAAIGITNQRETTVVWERRTGRPIANAIVWQDTRVAEDVGRYASNGGPDRFRPQSGLPLSTYFSSLKLRWLLKNIPDASAKAAGGDLLFGNIDTFLVWNLTGGPNGGVHVTDVTNASRTQLLNLETLDWDEKLLAAFEIPRAMLPQVRSSSEVYGAAKPPCDWWRRGRGHSGRSTGGACRTGLLPARRSEEHLWHGVLSADEHRRARRSFELRSADDSRLQIWQRAAHYALEGGVAIAGALVQWLRDNLGMIEKSADMETLARTVNDNGGVYFVPAFSGLYAPYWKENARGVIAGLTRYANKGHLAQGGPGSDGVSDARSGRSDGKGFGDRAVVVARRRRNGRERIVDAVPGGHSESRSGAPGDSGNDGARCGVRCGIGGEVLLRAGGIARQLGGGPDMDSRTFAEAERDELYKQWKKAVTRSFDWVAS